MSEIKQGQEFVCIKTAVMTVSKREVYTKGYIYKSEKDGCITNNENEKDHIWARYNKETKEHFLKIKKLKL